MRRDKDQEQEAGGQAAQPRLVCSTIDWRGDPVCGSVFLLCGLNIVYSSECRITFKEGFTADPSGDMAIW